MICSADTLQTWRNSAFVHNHSSSPCWPALAQGFRRAKNPGRWPRGSTDEAQSNPGSDSGNTTGPGMHWQGQLGRLDLACTGTPTFGPTVETWLLIYWICERGALLWPSQSSQGSRCLEQSLGTSKKSLLFIHPDPFTGS